MATIPALPQVLKTFDQYDEKINNLDLLDTLKEVLLKIKKTNVYLSIITDEIIQD